MIVFGYKYPGWNEKECAAWRVQSTVEINSGFNTLWTEIEDLCQVSTLGPPEPLSLDSLIHFALSRLTCLTLSMDALRIWLLFGSGALAGGSRDWGEERGQWCQGYYAIHSSPLMLLESGCLSTEGPCFGQNKCCGLCTSLSSKCPLSHPFPCFCVTSPAYCT